MRIETFYLSGKVLLRTQAKIASLQKDLHALGQVKPGIESYYLAMLVRLPRLNLASGFTPLQTLLPPDTCLTTHMLMCVWPFDLLSFSWAEACPKPMIGADRGVGLDEVKH
jgi:hypothetical protein